MMTQQEHDAHLARVFALTEKINPVLVGHDHKDVLGALISLYRLAANTFPCCAPDCIHHCTLIAEELQAKLQGSDVSMAPQSPALH